MTIRNKNKLRWALVGCGKIAHKHASVIAQHLENAELVGGVDLDDNMRATFSSQYQVPVFKSSDELIRQAEPDVISILTPTGTHFEVAMSLVPYKRHLVIEKPLVLKIAEAERLISACHNAKIKCFEVKQNRFNRPIQAARQALKSGRFGKLVLGTVRMRWTRDQNYYNQASWRGTWAHDGGVLANQANHHLDMLLWMMGDVASVQAISTRQLVDIEADDTTGVLLRFKSGALGVIEATTATRPKDIEGSISLLGEYGSVEIGGFSMNTLTHWAFSSPSQEDSEVFQLYGDNPTNNPLFAHTEYLKSVCQAIQDESASTIVEGAASIPSIRVLNAIYKANALKKEVVV